MPKPLPNDALSLAAVTALVDDRDKLTDRMTGKYAGRARNLHHRQLRSRGGPDTAGNLISLSGSGTLGSHGWVHAHPQMATRRGLMIPSWIDDPSAVPVKCYDSVGRPGWYRFDDDGHEYKITAALAAVVMRALHIWSKDESW